MCGYPKKRLGQNFLIDPNIIRKIIKTLALKPSDEILEVGAGRGELSCFIAPKVKKFYAVEVDKDLIPALRLRIKKYSRKIKIINEDILKIRLEKIFPGRRKIKVFGNIPYYISTPIIEYLIKYKNKISEAFLTVQKEFAERIVASVGSKNYASLSLFVHYYAVPKILFNIKKNCFYPAPQVDSSFLHLRFKKEVLTSLSLKNLLFKIIRLSFNYKRKTLKKSLQNLAPAQEIEEILLQCGKDAKSRPEELSLEDFILLTQKLSQRRVPSF